MKNAISVALLCLTYFCSIGQVSKLKDYIVIDASHLQVVGDIQKEEEQEFSFNKYCQLNLDDFSSSLPFDEVENYTLFFVFKQKKEGTIAKVRSKEHVIEFGDNYIRTMVDRPLEMEVNKPHILTYKGSSGRRLKNKIQSGEFKFTKSNTSNTSSSFDNVLSIADIIVYNKILSVKEVKIQESALSMKYGISLAKDSTYYGSHGDVIFSGKDHSDFNNRVSCIGLDSKYNFDKKKSRNTDESSRLTIRNLSDNTIDETYTFYSDNGEEYIFEEHRLKRTWRIDNNTNKTNTIDFNFTVDELELNNLLYDYYLVLSDYSDLKDPEEFLLDLSEGSLHTKVAYNFGEKYFSIVEKSKVNENLAYLELNIPSPSASNQDIPITLKSGLERNGTLKISTSEGQLILNSPVRVEENSPTKLSIKVSLSGIYFASFYNDEIIVTTKFIVF